MKTSDWRRLERRAEVLKAMVNRARLLLLETLAAGERCVCELHELAGGDFSTVSKHLAQLRRVGLVEREKRGLQVYYRLRGRWPLRVLEDAEKAAAAVRRENGK